jgi:ATP-dependent RNA helicase SUPV3L1/SUV3
VGGTVEEFEQAAAAARDAQTLLRQFPGVAGLSSDDAAWVEEECSETITEMLPGAIALGRSGKCTECGTAIAPWFTTCRPCSFRGADGHGHGDRDRRPGGGGRPDGHGRENHGRGADGHGGRRTTGRTGGRAARPGDTPPSGRRSGAAKGTRRG